MLLAAVNDTAYKAVLLIHIASFLVGFAPAAINPLLGTYFERNGGDPILRTWSGFAARYTQRFSLPALVVLFLTGVAMVLMSDDAWEFSQTWISLAFLVWFAICGVVSAVILKGEKAVANGDPAGMKLVEKGGPIATLLLAVMLYLMIFKPGL